MDNFFENRASESEIIAEVRRLEKIYKDYPVSLDTQQACEILCADESTVARYTRKGLPAYKKGLRKKSPFCFTKPDVLRFKAEHKFDFLRR